MHWACHLWSACLFAAILVTAYAIHRAPFPSRRETLVACGELLLLVAVGYAIRRFLMSTVLLDWPSRMPWPGSCGEPRNGPGYGMFANLCFWIAGVGDKNVVSGLVLVGALTAVPVYLLLRLSTGRRGWAFAAGLALALLEPHARMSRADDPAALVAFFVVSAVALAEAARATGVASFAAAAALSAALAAMTRPEVSSAFAVVIAFLVLDRPLRSALRRPAVLALALAACAAVVLSFRTAVSSRHAAGQPLIPGVRAMIEVLWGLFTQHIVVLPPAAPALFGLFLAAGLIACARATRGRALVWLLVGLAPVVASMRDAGTSVAEKHQVSLLPVVAAFAGAGAAWLAGAIAARLPKLAIPAQLAAGAASVAVMAHWLRHPPPAPTFVLEYQFFEQHLAEIPEGCTVLYPKAPGGNGLQPPILMSRLRGHRHDWERASDTHDPDQGCLAYWKPAACHHGVLPQKWYPWVELFWDVGWAGDSNDGSVADAFVVPRDCYVIERAYRLEPIAETQLPARFGHRGMYRSDPVPVGFYRLRRREDAAAR